MKSKKDPNYLAAVERAIAEKYGKNTVQDFRNEWEEDKEKDYLIQLKERSALKGTRNKKYTTLEDGSVQIRKPNKDKAADRTCPVCKTYSFSRKDDLYMNRFKCCQDCYYEFVHDREERWQEGWRPNEERVQIALKRRKKQHG